MSLTETIKENLNNHTIIELSNNIGVSSSTLRDFIFNPKRKFKKELLDKIYNYFGYKKDKSYKSRLYSQYRPINLLGAFFRKKRIEKNLKVKEVAKKILGSERHLLRIESGRINFVKDGYYIKALSQIYGLNDKEKEILNKNLEALKELYKIIKN